MTPCKLLARASQVVFRPRAGLAGARERELEMIIRRTCEAAVVAALHPRTVVQVVVQVVAEDGAVLACAINAACAALLEAAVPLSSLFAAVSAASSEEGALLMDPTAAEEGAARACATFAFLASAPLEGSSDASPGGQQPGSSSAGPALITSSTTGVSTFAELQQMMAACQSGAERLLAFQRQSVTQ